MKNGIRRPLLATCLLLLCLLIASCGGRFWYNQADWLIDWFLDDYIDFYPDQKRQFDQRLNRLLAWHRNQELPRYVLFLGRLQEDLQTPMSVGQVGDYADGLWALWQDTMVQALPDIQAILKTLDEEQCREMLLRIEKNQGKFEKKYADIDVEELRELRIKRMKKNLRKWIGGLQADQEAIIVSWADGMTNLYPELMASQRLWAAKVATALAVRQQEDVFRSALQTLFIHPESLWSESYRQLSAKNRQQTLQMLVRIQHSLNPEQAQHLSAELEQWRSNFQALSLDR